MPNQSTWEALKEKSYRYLCPPGNGVYTVATGKKRKERLQQKLYGTTDADKVRLKWQQAFEKIPATDLPLVLGISSDCGGGILRGANWGPLFVREALYQQYPDLKLLDIGDVRVIPHLLLDKYLNQETIQNVRAALYQDPTVELPVSPLSITQDFASSFYALFPDKKLFSIGGDHSVSYPLCHSFLTVKKAQGKKVAIVHFDAHTDLSQQRLGIDINFGSWAYHVLDQLPAPDHLIQLGLRMSAKNKAHWESTLGVKQWWADEIKQQSVAVVSQQVITHLHNLNVDEIYISFDIDVMDASIVSATGTPEADGLLLDDALELIAAVTQNFNVTAADLMEVAPLTRGAETRNKEPDSTLNTAAAIANALL